MNHGVKRYRQTSIMESFAFSKKAKGNLTEEATNNQMQLMADCLLNKSSPEGLVTLQKTESNRDSSSLLKKKFCETSGTKNEKEKSDAAKITQMSIIDQSWDRVDEDIEIMSEKHHDAPGDSSLSKKELCETSDTKNKKEKNYDDATATQMSIIDQLWGIDDGDIEVKNEKHQDAPSLKSVTDQSCEEENSYRSSADLFPEEPSLEDHPVPSSSGGSQELFDSQEELFGSQSSYEEVETVESSSESESETIVVLYRSPDCDMPLPKLEPSENHSIMFSPHIRPGDAPRPFPKSYRDKWDVDHVRMPCSSFNKYPVENSMGETVIGSRWNLICQSLMTDIATSKDLERAIMKYNRQHIGKWNFLGLHSLINEHWLEEERDHFFETMLPVMIEMALNLPNVCTQAVPLLKKGKDHYVTMSQKQIGCLLLNAFFCTFPRRNPRNKQAWNSEYATYPDINFNRLFYGTKSGCPRSNAEKLKCLFNYFRRIISEEPSGTITFHRQMIPFRNLPKWYSSTRGIRTAVVKSHGLIEEDGKGLLQVDFANRYIGGGVLGFGCVQEEIRFVVCPELIVSRLFVESLEDNEALIITGAEQYNKYSGYGDTFKWEGDFRDNVPRDLWGRRCTKIVAIDATHFKKTSDQFTFRSIKRELNKAYCGFYEKGPPICLPAIATGNWGCGAFRGSVNIKFLIQLMAASECGRNLVYYTFQNKKLKKELQNMYEFLDEKNLDVGDLWRLIIDYVNNLNGYKSEKPTDLYSFIYSQFQTKKISHLQSNCNELTLSCKKAAELLYDEFAMSSSQGSEEKT